MSAGLKITDTGIDKALAGLRPLIHADDEEILTSIGAVIESQTRRRITDEKTAPDGTAWAPNHKGTSILLETGQHLLGTISFQLDGSEAVEVGSSWEYAHVHQGGAVIKPVNAKALAIPGSAFGGSASDTIFAQRVVIPDRPFLGISDDNAREILDVITDAFGLLQ